MFKSAQEDLFGLHFKILSYDAFGNNAMTLFGDSVAMGLKENAANGDSESTGFKSEVLDITVNGKQLLHVGSTLVLAEDGIDMVEDYDIEYLKNAQATSGGTGFIPLDRTINHWANLIGKPKTIIVRSQNGIIIGVYQGKSVYVEIPDDLPKTTRLMVDGKRLYIYRADYDIFDTEMLQNR